MKRKLSADVWLALFFLIFALVLVFIWVPFDTGTGLVEKVRRKYQIGDALAPTFAGGIIGLGALFVFARPLGALSISRQNVIWVMSLILLFTGSLILMRYAGPIAAYWTETGYRPLRATAPWNYIGFLLGGTILVGGLTSLTCKRLSWQDFVIGFAAALIIALLYDLPFEDLILPPNGDV